MCGKSGGLYCNDFIVTSVEESGGTHTLRPMMIYNDIEHDIGNANKASRGVEPIKKKKCWNIGENNRLDLSQVCKKIVLIFVWSV